MYHAITLLALLPIAAAAQGVVRGTVRDPHGAPIRGAVVGVPGTTLYDVTDPAGRYRLAPVPAGELRVRAAAIGFAPASTTVQRTVSSRIAWIASAVARRAMPASRIRPEKNERSITAATAGNWR